MTTIERISAPISFADGRLPQGWERARLGEVLSKSEDWIEIQPEHEYAQVTVRLWGKGVTRRGLIQGAEIAASRQLQVHRDQFILSRIDARNGAFGLVPTDLEGAVVSNDFPAFDLDMTRIVPGFLGWMSRTHDFVELCKRASEGTTNRVRLQEGRFLAAEIALPPLDEQRRIVARIEALAARIAEARELRREAGELANALARDIVDATLNKLSPKCREATVEEVALSVTDGDHVPPPKAESGIPFILISNITTGRLDLANCRWVPEDYFEQLQEARVPRQGDVLYVAVGATYGTPCLVDTDRPFCFQRHIAIIRPDQAKILPSYMLWALRSETAYRQATRFVTGSAQPTVPLRGIRKLRFPLPSLAEQQRVVTHFDRLYAWHAELAREQAESSAKLDALLPAMLDRAFRGNCSKCLHPRM